MNECRESQQKKVQTFKVQKDDANQHNADNGTIQRYLFDGKIYLMESSR